MLEGGGSHLHEAAQAEGGVVEAADSQEVLSGSLDAHERDLGVAVTVVDAVENVALNAHRLCALDQCHLRTRAYGTGFSERLRVCTGTTLFSYTLMWSITGIGQ